MLPTIGFCDMFLQQISALEFAVMGGTGGTADHHLDAFHNDR